MGKYAKKGTLKVEWSTQTGRLLVLVNKVHTRYARLPEDRLSQVIVFEVETDQRITPSLSDANL